MAGLPHRWRSRFVLGELTLALVNRPASARPFEIDREMIAPRPWSRLLLAHLALARPIARPAHDPRTLLAEMPRTPRGRALPGMDRRRCLKPSGSP